MTSRLGPWNSIHKFARNSRQCTKRRNHLPSSFRMASSSSSTLNAASTTRTTLKFTAVTVLVSLASYTLGCVYTPPILSLLYPKPYVWPTELGDPDSLESRQYLATLENQLQSIPLLQQSRKDPTTSAWLEARPYSTVPPDRRVNHLTAGVLNGIGKMAILPLARIRPDQQETWFFVHLGRKLCGHDGIVHGGLIATLLDETLAWTVCVYSLFCSSRVTDCLRPRRDEQALVNLPEQIGVTASLNIKYRAPTKADQV